MNQKNNIILQKSFDFAIEIIELYKILNSKGEFIISKQLFRAATSIGANVNEGTAAASKKDFINKMIIASKEARETEYWLLLLEKSQLVACNYLKYLTDISEINKILTSIVKTSQENLETK
ncbi:MAG TPA: four helix bundle protein [Melioribacteraceae bacterium]|nr:four helix bundle protein [Melioribacteraceae bacterium]